MTVGTLNPGSFVASRYRVIRPIAEGGMGAVYEVEHPATGARRALKIMHGEIARDERLRVRFIQEARVGATIQSDHVAKVIDAGVDEQTGMLYIVMDLLVGRTLSQEIKHRGALTLRETHEMLRQTCHAVAAAHQMGIVHRDLKPSNIFLSAPQIVGMEFMVRVLDFGIAKVVADAAAGATAIVGTPSWMAPEQTDPRAQVGPATDVWPLGLIVFRSLTGCHYFPSGNIEGAATAAMLRDVVIEPIVPGSHRAAQYGAGARWPQALDPWFARCVARDPAQRFPSAGDAYNAFVQIVAPLLGASPGGGGTGFSMASGFGAGGGGPQQPTWRGSGIGEERGTAVETAVPWAGQSRPGSQSFTGAETSPAQGQRRRSRAPLAIVAGFVVTAAIAAGVFFLVTRNDGGAAGGSASGAASTLPPSSSASGSASALAALPKANVVLRMHGSNTVGEELGPALAEAFLKRRTGVTGVHRQSIAEDELLLEAHPEGAAAEAVEIKAHGSNTAFTDLDTGAADVGMASRRVTDAEVKKLERLGALNSAASEHVVALDGIAIVVNPANPLAKIGRGLVAKVLSGEATRWSAVGGRDAPIVVYARGEESGTTDVVKALVLGGKPIAPSATRIESNEKLSDAVAADANGLGYVGLAAVRSSKPLMIEDNGALPLLPSPETLAAEDYLLTRRLYLYTPARPTEVARAFVDFALSDDGQKIVANTGFVDLRPSCEVRTSVCERCPKEYRELVAGACRVSSTFRFESGTSQPDSRALRDLVRMSTLLRRPELANKNITLIGFADGGPGGRRLGQRRRRRPLARLRQRRRGAAPGAGLPHAHGERLRRRGAARGRRERSGEGAQSARRDVAEVGLPKDLARAVRTASVPPHLRVLAARLPRAIEVTAQLPDTPPPSALQLLKLATLGEGLSLGEATAAGEGGRLRIVLSVGGRPPLVLGPADLDGETLAQLLRRAFTQLLSPEEAFALLEGFARESAQTSTLGALTRQMLVSTDLDPALYAMLSGVTSGHGLAFHRAALFVYDQGAGRFFGSKAIGPHDEEEAHRIWEEIEYEGKELSGLFADYAAKNVDSRLEVFVRGLSVGHSEEPDDEVAEALRSRGPVLFERDRLVSADLAALIPSRSFILAAVRPRGELRALLFADNVYGAPRIAPERVEMLGLFVDQLALVWENLLLLRKVEELARFDPLTSVYNRRVLLERLREAAARAERSGQPCAMIAVDLDDLKRVNDAGGHAAGDRALTALAAALKSGVRAEDTVARLGGDEFAVLLPGATRDFSMTVAKRLGDAARAAGISVSVGCAAWPEDVGEALDLLAAADARLYEAKRRGRGRAVCEVSEVVFGVDACQDPSP